MASKKKRPQEIQPELADKLEAALGHPIRAWCLAKLNDAPASAADLARLSGEKRNTVHYHMQVLERLGCIELVERTPVRGAEKKIYRGITRMLLDGDIWRRLSPQARTGISVKAVGESFERAQKALEAGTFDHRLDRVVVNHKPSLDEEGWQEAVEILREAHERIEQLEPEAIQRTPELTGRRRFTISLLGYESPPGR